MALERGKNSNTTAVELIPNGTTSPPRDESVTAAAAPPPPHTVGYDRGGSMTQLVASCKRDTGLDPPRPQWENDPYGPHTGLEYVRRWYERMRAEGMGAWDGI